MESQDESARKQRRQVVLAYGAALEGSPQDDSVLDASQLPRAKDAIRAAILSLLDASKNADQDKVLCLMLLRLCEFQDGVGETPQPVSASSPDGEPWWRKLEEERRSLATDLLERFSPRWDFVRTRGEGQTRVGGLLSGGTSVDARERHSLVSALQDAERVLGGAAEHVLAAYGQALDDYSPYENREAVDVSRLPYPKATVSGAILLSLGGSPDFGQQEFLKSAFIKLADFQEGVGEDPVDASTTEPWASRVVEERGSLVATLLEAGHPLDATDLEHAQQVLAAYGETLTTFSPRENRSVVDAAQLPYPKATIQAAILRLLDAAEDFGNKQLLKSALIELSHFQDGVGEEPVDAGGTEAGGAQWPVLVERDAHARVAALHAAGHALDETPVEHAERVLAAYGETVTAFSPQENEVVVDASQLPYPKAVVQGAILALLDSAEDPDQKQVLKSALVRLAHFLEGVGDDPASADPTQAGGAQWRVLLERERKTLAAALQEAGHPLDEIANAQEVLAAYGETLTTFSPEENGVVVDASQLPHAKPVIHAAILRLLASAEDAEPKKVLRSAFAKLARFQEGVGANPVDAGGTQEGGAPWSTVLERERQALVAALQEAGHAAEETSIEYAQQVLAAYGETLDALAPGAAGLVGDVSRLPFPKTTIHGSILQLLDTTRDSEEKGVLRSAFIRLAFFQEGVGEHPQQPGAPDASGEAWATRVEAEQKSQARALHEAGHPLSESPLEQAQQVLSAYGKDLDTFQPRERGVVVDASRLSHPKATIKASILRLLDASEDPSQSALLESAFVKLADFQHGVGESPAALSAPDNRALSAAVDAERRTLFAVLKRGGHLRKS